MKNILYLIAALVLLVQFSCGPNVRFEVPQPAGVKHEKKFSAKYQGEYISQNQELVDSRLAITDSSIIYDVISFNLPKQMIDSIDGVIFKEGRLIVSEEMSGSFWQDTMRAEIEGDTVRAFLDITDTIVFDISEELILKKYRGSYFLNDKKPDDTWSVQIMSLDKKGLLSFSAFEGGEENLPEIEEITPVIQIEDEHGEVRSYLINPSKQELREMINSNLLQLEDQMFFLEGGNFQKVK